MTSIRPIRIATPTTTWAKFRLVLFVLLAILMLSFVMRKETKWRYTSPVASPRALYTSLPLPDGRILFSDGYIHDSRSNKLIPSPHTIQVFDPKTDSWNSPVKSPQAVDPTSMPQEGERMHSHPGLWQRVLEPDITFSGAMPTGPAKYGNDAASVAVPIHFKNGSVLSIFYFFELNTPGIAAKPVSSAPSSLYNPVFNLIVLPDERVFFGTGDALDGSAYEMIYSPKKDSWQFLNDPLATVGQTTTLLPDGKILAIGGAVPYPTFKQRMVNWYQYLFPPQPFTIRYEYNLAYQMTATCRLYDPATNTWRITQSLNQPRAFHTTNLLPDGRILVSGGYTAPNDDSTTDTCEIISLNDIEKNQ